MKKWMIFCIVTICLFTTPINCMAKPLVSPAFDIESAVTEGQVLLATGYTEDGIYYEVYGEKLTTNPNARHDIEIERTVIYDGRILPPQTLEWVEVIGVYEYKGTLTLSSFYYNATTNQTTGIYVGIVTG